ncbi:hypothetical protein EXS62_01290 [Candidatus Kaiserbacteria bacterium]|nr:hypothetical protein [Candidatus Kaiserbacteria bacterium]
MGFLVSVSGDGITGRLIGGGGTGFGGGGGGGGGGTGLGSGGGGGGGGGGTGLGVSGGVFIMTGAGTGLGTSLTTSFGAAITNGDFFLQCINPKKLAHTTANSTIQVTYSIPSVAHEATGASVCIKKRAYHVPPANPYTMLLHPCSLPCTI